MIRPTQMAPARAFSKLFAPKKQRVPEAPPRDDSKFILPYTALTGLMQRNLFIVPIYPWTPRKLAAMHFLIAIACPIYCNYL